MENKRIKVSVFVAGQRFNILTDKSEKYVLDIASQIDARINSLSLSGNMTRERAAVLTALDYADDSVLDRENIAAVKEQIKDYVQEIERLQDNNAKLVSDYNLLKAEYERLVEEHQSAEEAQKALKESQEQNASLQEQLTKAQSEADDLRQQLTAVTEEANKAQAEGQSREISLKKQLTQAEEALRTLRLQMAQPEEIAPLPEEAPAAPEKPITAEDDLFFEPEEEPSVKPDKKKKNRHEHSHVNPYQQKAKDKEKKGYTQQRQYSFFDVDE